MVIASPLSTSDHNIVQFKKKSFFFYVNNRKPIQCKIDQLIDAKSDNEVIANLFNEYFASVLTEENNSTPEPRIRFKVANDSALNTIICSYEYVEKGLNQGWARFLVGSPNSRFEKFVGWINI